MGMSDTERKAISSKLRTAAVRCINVVDKVANDVKKGHKSKAARNRAEKLQRWVLCMEKSWRSFPECRDDKTIPPPAEVIEIVNRMDRDARNRFAGV